MQAAKISLAFLLSIILLSGIAFASGKAIKPVVAQKSFNDMRAEIGDFKQLYNSNVKNIPSIAKFVLGDGEVKVNLNYEGNLVSFSAKIQNGIIADILEKSASPHTEIFASKQAIDWIARQPDVASAIGQEFGKGIRYEGIAFDSKIKLFIASLGLKLINLPKIFAQANETQIIIPLKINVLDGIIAKTTEDQWSKPTKEKLEKDLNGAVGKVNKILKDCGPQIGELKINWDVPDPDGVNDGNMGNYDDETLDKVSKSANDELKKHFGDGKSVRGFKIYIVGQIQNKKVNEFGLGYWFNDGGDLSPGFSMLEAEHASDGRALAHEIGHGLGCLEHSETEEDNLMYQSGNPAGDNTKLTKKQCEDFKKCASKRS